MVDPVVLIVGLFCHTALHVQLCCAFVLRTPLEETVTRRHKRALYDVVCGGTVVREAGDQADKQGYRSELGLFNHNTVNGGKGLSGTKTKKVKIQKKP